MDQINQFKADAVTTPGFENKKLQTIKESDESLQTAIEKVTESKRNMEESGNTVGAEALRQTLTRLEDLASQQQAQVESLENKTLDQDSKREIQQHLSEIKKARKKAGDALKLELDKPTTED